MKKYRNEVKAFVVTVYSHGYKIHHITRVFKISSGTVWRWINTIKGKIKYRRMKIDSIRQRLHDQHLKNLFINLLSWLSYQDKYGIFDLDKVCKGERPP